MDMNEIEEHWKAWAREFKLDIRATTRTRTIKELEIAAFYRAFRQTPFLAESGCRVLEVGCGNGHNCFMLRDLIPTIDFTGVDLVPEMIAHANQIRETSSNYSATRFLVGNVLALDECTGLDDQYHIVFTNRCLINLNTHEMQLQALEQLCRKTVDGGFIVMIENVEENYARQNQLRVLAGLPPRTPAPFNLFIDEASFLSHAGKILTLVNVEDFASLHDLLLYVLVPMINDGQVDYESPVVSAATTLLLAIPDEYRNAFGSFGQNRLYMFRKGGDNGR